MSEQFRPDFFLQPDEFFVFPDDSKANVLFAHLKLCWLLSRGLLIDDEIADAVLDQATHLGRSRLSVWIAGWNQEFVNKTRNREEPEEAFEARSLAYQEMLMLEMMKHYDDPQPSSVNTRVEALRQAEVVYFGTVLNEETY